MVPNSPIFIFLFLPLILGLYFAAPVRLKNPLLLGVSLFYYAWSDSASLWVLVFSALANYAFGRLVGSAGVARKRGAFLAAGVGVNLALLLYYKYLKFLITNLGALKIVNPEHFDFSGHHLPLGISFFTFGAIAYLVDIYRGKTGAERGLTDFGLYVSLFPKIMAGPIVRYADLERELKGRSHTIEDFSFGVQRFIIGLGKKVLIANTVATIADEAFRAPAALDMPTAWLGILCYTLQIYFDFSGYSDMAIGLGRMFGFTFMENFNYPYISRSVQEFWRRWHISLSTWFRDYLYIPLGGNRCSEGRTYFNLVVVFLLCGFWHGASWSYVVWGAYHGLFLVVERFGLFRVLQKARPPLGHVYGVLAVMIGWVFFRAEDLSQAVAYLHAMFSFKVQGFDYFYMTFLNRQMLLSIALGIIGCMPAAQAWKLTINRMEERKGPALLLLAGAHHSVARPAFMTFVFIASVMQLAISTYSPFIYTKF